MIQIDLICYEVKLKDDFFYAKTPTLLSDSSVQRPPKKTMREALLRRCTKG
jgi:hypothetical protein